MSWVLGSTERVFGRGRTALDIARDRTYGPGGPFYAIAALGMMIALLAIPFMMRKNRKDPLSRFSFKEERLDDDLVNLRSGADNGNLSGLAPFLEPTNKEELSETGAGRLRSAGLQTADQRDPRVYYFARAALGAGHRFAGAGSDLLLPRSRRSHQFP